MPRKLRDRAPGIHHVYARGNAQQAIFLGDDDRRCYLELWEAIAGHFDWRCLAYCLMKNHVHHLVETRDESLSLGIQLAHGGYARWFNEAHGRVGHLFQGRYGSARAPHDGSVRHYASYIALNPVRADLCARPDDYRWSSHAAAVGKADPPRWLDLGRLLEFFAEDGRSPRQVYIDTVATSARMTLPTPPPGS